MQYAALSSANIDAIQALFTHTFTDSEGAQEGAAIGQLAAALATTTPAEELRIFAAHDGDQLAACVLFTRLHFAGAEGDKGREAWLLSPMAVATAMQGKGIGQGLIRYGLAALKAQGAELAVTYGDPKFYGKLGFEAVTIEQVPAPQPLSFPHGWLAQTLEGEAMPTQKGPVRCAEALNRPEFW
ncbi:GNAT family N-acetyltransferase [Ferrimonas marina]|uniref:Predicted N-acetyltransferase YhbS n=1 Tax=Ferrimonas marina TaxID=299255 RepID=A0A1M5Y0Q2_9GAMM|nr:N-acetyltransferase [Ferrimonas marina]SHI05378.1 Predicted N-acetyltransferase YhbS [Ferrimonas marina]